MDKFCTACGTQHVVQSSPQKCPACKVLTWSNPKPVVALVMPVSHPERPGLGVLIGRRAIPPKIGEYGLIAGHIENCDASAEAAMLREFREETGIDVPFTPDDIRLESSYGDGRVIIVFGVCQKLLPYHYTAEFVTNSECDAIEVIWEPQNLCFPSHTAALTRFYESQTLAYPWNHPNHSIGRRDP